MADSAWPPLPVDGWTGTYATLHLWTQVVGKIALASAPPLNHSWGIAFHLTPRGMTALPLSHRTRTFTIEFDFIAHQLVVRTADGDIKTLALEPRPVADFYRRVMALMRDMGLPVKIWPVSVETASAIRIDGDDEHRAYDPAWANAHWRILTSVARAFVAERCRFVGKASPAHFFWGGFDLALTRFSGRPAPPRDGPAFMQEAYSHEVISHGFWPGSLAVAEPSFYAYAVPEPAGLKTAAVRPDAAVYHAEMGEFILPYEAVRTAPSPEQAVREFVTSTYDAAATLGGWDPALVRR